MSISVRTAQEVHVLDSHQSTRDQQQRVPYQKCISAKYIRKIEMVRLTRRKNAKGKAMCSMFKPRSDKFVISRQKRVPRAKGAFRL